jgi:hypothetical protein
MKLSWLIPCACVIVSLPVIKLALDHGKAVVASLALGLASRNTRKLL